MRATGTALLPFRYNICKGQEPSPGRSHAAHVARGHREEETESMAGNVTDRQRELTELLRKAADAYYNDDIEIMSNYEYDALFDELAALEQESGESLPGSVVANVGVPIKDETVSGLAKVHHETPMLSLGKTKDRDSLAGWLGGHDGCLSFKLDGSTVTIDYDGGRMTRAVTRGNGLIGEDVSAQARLFHGVPERIPFTGHATIRGEALMTYPEFERVNSLQPETDRYKNPRNLASGTMRQLDLAVLRERRIDWHPFELIDADGVEENSFAARLDLLAEWGFSPVEHIVVTPDDVTAGVATLEARVPEIDEPSDGLVLMLDDVAYGRSLGATGHHPRSGIALKWADESYDTHLTGIEWYGSRTGRLNPVAVFEPVEIDGTTVTKASMHNVSVLRDVMGEPFVGQTVSVAKANMIIPMVVSADKDAPDGATMLDMPSRCPICGGVVSVHRDHDSEVLYCENPDCAAKNIKRLAHFVSRDALNVMGLSDRLIEDLVDAGVVSTFADILDIPSRRDDIVGKAGTIQERGFENLSAAVEAARHTEARRVLYSFGIREVGRSASRDICKAYGNDLHAIIADARAGDADRFTALDGVGPIMARELIDYVRVNGELMEDVISRLDVTDAGDAGEDEQNDFVTGRTFVITGAVHRFANRSGFKEYVEARGGKVSGSVSKNTDYLVTNTPDSGTGKNRKARELNVPVITEDEFCERAGMDA